MSELFKDLPGYEGVYQVSNFGRIKCLPIEYTSGVDNKAIKKKTEQLMSTSLMKCGYERLCLTIDKKRKSYLVHRLVASAFLEKKEGLDFINHKNGVKSDNVVDNLEWCTRSENILHAIRIGLKPALIGDSNPNSKTINQFDLNGNYIQTFTTVKEACKTLEISLSAMQNVLNGKWKQCKGFIFQEADKNQKL